MIFQGIRTSIAKEPHSSVIFLVCVRGGGGSLDPPPTSGCAHVSKYQSSKFQVVTLEIELIVMTSSEGIAMTHRSGTIVVIHARPITLIHLVIIISFFSKVICTSITPDRR